MHLSIRARRQGEAREEEKAGGGLKYGSKEMWENGRETDEQTRD